MNLLWRYYEFIFVILSLYFVFTGENVIWCIFHIHGFITCFLSMTLVILSKKFQSSRSGKLTWLVDEALILRRRSISSNKSLVITRSAIMNAKQLWCKMQINIWMFVNGWKLQGGIRMILSFPLLLCESSVSVKENSDTKKWKWITT